MLFQVSCAQLCMKNEHTNKFEICECELNVIDIHVYALVSNGGKNIQFYWKCVVFR
jgi:hypothetical protein